MRVPHQRLTPPTVLSHVLSSTRLLPSSLRARPPQPPHAPTPHLPRPPTFRRRRSKRCTLRIRRSALSRIHAKLEWEPTSRRLAIHNCSQNHKTFLNGKALGPEGAVLALHDVVLLGSAAALVVVRACAGACVRESNGDDGQGGGEVEASVSVQVSAGRGAGAVNAVKYRSRAHKDAREHAQEVPASVRVDFDGEPLSAEDEVEGEGKEVEHRYVDRAEMRRCLHADAERLLHKDAHRRREEERMHREAVGQVASASLVCRLVL